MLYTIGEILLDIIFRDGQPVAARPGGAMLNTAVSLGRCGHKVALISELGSDTPGTIILNFLESNHVDVSYIRRHETGKTGIALAFLDEKGDASYTFYKDYPEERLNQPKPHFSSDDILLFGSFYSLIPEVRKPVMEIVGKAREAGATIIYDPNIRSPHKHEMGEKRPSILENISYARIVRASDEDFKTAFDVTNSVDAWEICRSQGCPMLMYTMNAGGVRVFTEASEDFYPVAKIKPLSTIGAGDNFNAGVMHAMARGNALQETAILAENGIAFATDVCLSYDNYVSWEFAKERG
ncbi:MAG: carbohydrate kinase [Bacteroidetes bacterium]|nr:carbohydrate kinase [Bacteroidota bacterium]